MSTTVLKGSPSVQCLNLFLAEASFLLQKLLAAKLNFFPPNKSQVRNLQARVSNLDSIQLVCLKMERRPGGVLLSKRSFEKQIP